MLRKLIETDGNDIAALIARVFLGIVILPHGMQKLLGMFGGYGFGPTVEFFSGIGVPAFIAVLVILGDSFGALFLILGLISRVSAAGITLIMLGAVFLLHLPNGFFMNWEGAQRGEGFEFHILALGLALIVLLRGGGKWSLDGMIGGSAD
ncbi:MAG: DoxX family protein [Thermodesulfobacteriota bacterium]